jgi:hypothetical protein
MIKIRPNVAPDKSLSFEFNLDSEARIRTVRDMEWVEQTPEIVKAKLIFSYEHFPINNFRKSEWRLQLSLGDLILDFQSGSYVFKNQEYEKPWPFNLFLFRVTPSHFLLYGTYKPPLMQCFGASDIVVFECLFQHSTLIDSQWLRKFQNFNWNVSENINLDYLLVHLE